MGKVPVDNDGWFMWSMITGIAITIILGVCAKSCRDADQPPPVSVVEQYLSEVK